MIYGIGTDIVLISRIRSLQARWGDRLARRVLGPDELLEYQRRHSRGSPGPERAARYLAKRFAAKEAFSKAIGLGLRGPMTLLSLQVLNDRRGKPIAVPRKALEPWLRERGLVAHVSISDEIDSALAFVVVEQHTGVPPSEESPAQQQSARQQSAKQQAAQQQAAQQGSAQQEAAQQEASRGAVQAARSAGTDSL